VTAHRSPLRNDALAGQVVLVTGGGSGIGRATALACAQAGAKVATCGRRPEPLAAVEAELTAAGHECLAVPGDVREPEQVDAIVAGVLERFGAIDVLVNNAGGQFVAPAEEISDGGWRAVHRLAVDAVWSITRRCAVASMIPRRTGLIVFIAFSPSRGIPGFAHASSARAAVTNLASGLSLEWSRFGIRAVSIEVGNIRTEAMQEYDEADIANWLKAIPLGRFGESHEIGEVIAFLASSGGAYLTGTTIAVDGGMNAWGQGTAAPSPEPAAGPDPGPASE
jgi:citronellol/citronellal dehydrogenase